MEQEIIQTLYQYNDWANTQLLENAAKLDEASYRKDFGQAWGSVHGTLAHLLDADRIWLARWHGESPLGRPDGGAFTTLSEVRSNWEKLMTERWKFISGLKPGALAAVLEYKNTKGEPFANPLWWQMVHVVNHGTDHRSHLSIMMTEIGFPPPALDFIAYMRLR